MVVINITKSNELNNLVQKFLRIINKFNAWESKPQKYGTDTLLYRSEVHTIEAIGLSKSINVTQLAAYQGVTKGAVSQMIDKLIKKEMVTKTILSPKENEVALQLTEKGMQVYNAHSNYHKELYSEVSKIMESLARENKQALLDIFDVVECFLDGKTSE